MALSLFIFLVNDEPPSSSLELKHWTLTHKCAAEAHSVMIFQIDSVKLRRVMFVCYVLRRAFELFGLQDEKRDLE